MHVGKFSFALECDCMPQMLQQYVAWDTMSGPLCSRKSKLPVCSVLLSGVGPSVEQGIGLIGLRDWMQSPFLHLNDGQMPLAARQSTCLEQHYQKGMCWQGLADGRDAIRVHLSTPFGAATATIDGRIVAQYQKVRMAPNACMLLVD